MPPRVLLVATATIWHGTARMPRDLAKAGWDVSLLAPKGSLAEYSRYLQKIAHLPDGATLLQWVHAFAAMVKATAPQLVLPCDDTAFRLMQQLVTAPPANMQPVLQFQLATLITESLGNPSYYRASVDKTLLIPAAEALGVRVPPYAIVADIAAAESFAAAHGWPIVLKRSHSSAGDGVAVCADPYALQRDFAQLLAGATLDLNDTDTKRLIVQAFIPGRTQYYNATAWRGSLLCGFTVDKLEGAPRGPASVVRYSHSPELQQSVTKLIAGFGVTGLFVPEYIAHERTGVPYLVEINRRITPGTHRGGYIDVGAGAALFAAVEGVPSKSRTRLDDGEERIFVSFPHEWLRDPQSEYLRKYPVDVPWDEPELIEAMLALRHQP